MSEHENSFTLSSAKVRDSVVEFSELRGSTSGTEYFYVNVGGELVHIAQLPGARETFEREWGGGRKEYKVEVPIDALRNHHIYKFSFSRRTKYPRVYGCYLSGSEVKARSISWENVVNLNFKPIGNEGLSINQYKAFVPKAVEEINEIKARRSFKIFFSEHAERTFEALASPYFGLFTSLILPNANSRARSLKAKIQSVHEIWCLCKLIDFLNAEVREPLETSHDKYLWIATAQETPTGWIKTPYGEFTLWYQFPIIEQLITVALGMTLRKRIHVRPDIVIFPGRVKKAEDIRDLENARITKSALVIDAKIEVKEEDVEQLKDYVRFFKPKSKFMVLCLSKLDNWTRASLEKSGWKVFENVVPGMPLSELRDEVIKALTEIKTLN